MAENASPVQSIDRVIDIIETLSGASHGMTLKELSQAVDLHTSTVHRLLAALAARDYVFKDAESGKYRLTMRMFQVGSRVVGGINLVSTARPSLERLADLTGETIHLVARHGDEVVYLYKEDTTNSVVRMASFVGMRSSMYCTAVGKAILARLPEAEVRSIWGRTQITVHTPRTITTVDDLLADLTSVRSRGYALDDQEHETGVLCIGAPLYDYGSTPIGAVSISCPAARMDEETIQRFAGYLLDCTASISALLGGAPSID